ncbi:MAG TPA: sigma-70 family RNA polymerase sigma factor [Kofleriaceae bacterium]
MTAAVPWSDVAARLRPFVARRVDASDVDDVMQDVLLRVHRGLGSVADETRFTAWMYQVARNAIADQGRVRARHPLADGCEAEPIFDEADAHAAETLLAACLTVFVARLPSPYREAVTLVELEGMTAKGAAELVGVSASGMKSRVQRGRARLREMLDECCAIALDVRGHVTEVAPKGSQCCAAATTARE